MNYRPYFILGEVSGPGAYPSVNGMRVLSAVAAAGGYTRRADQNFVIITRNGENYRADLMTFIQPDDIIRVYERYLF
jgi:polysaccharide export outer membrane protein